MGIIQISNLIVISYQCASVGVGPLVQQQFSDSVVTTVCCHMQRCQVVQRDIINWRLVLKKVFDTLNMVALSRHVERREAILRNKRSSVRWREMRREDF